MSIQEKKTQKVIIPDQLNIIIRTSVPGYQKIEYKPSMTIKDSHEKGVKFNPLIKLNQSTIDKIPEEYRIKQFFNKGLFQSLLNYNGGTPAKSLLQATRNGYVDNNINVTLNSIFPVGSVIYIGKKPYVIADHQWTKGDWKIYIKQKKEEIDPSRYPSLNKIDGGDGANYQYRPNYRQLYPFRYSRQNYIKKKPDEQGTSKLAYTITIDLEVHPGTSLTPEQISQSKCNSRYNAIRKAYSEFRGKPYVIPPVYLESKNNTKKNLVQTKGGKRKTKIQIRTRKTRFAH